MKYTILIVVVIMILISLLMLHNWKNMCKNESFQIESENDSLPTQNISFINQVMDNTVNKPSKIKLRAKAINNIVSLYWLPPNSDLSNLKYYTIHMIKDEEDPKLIFVKDVSCTYCKYTFDNLEYDSTYKFNIFAVNKSGVSEISNTITVIPTSPLKKVEKRTPKKVIKNINCLEDGTYTLDQECIKQQIVKSNIDDDSHSELMNLLVKKTKNLNFDIKIF